MEGRNDSAEWAALRSPASQRVLTAEAHGRALLSATVVGPDLAHADAYATVVMGVAGVRWIASQTGDDAAVVTPSQRLVRSPGIGRLRT